ncbi:diaminopimelate epimerase [bacterium endosymbiont of Pedicinus badii]|uniref:diaminopimelate epimerase n=1 Tax=bacterium endosymbiont of Pedicinus badii TaxID=1719126 RepID=UPI0009B9A582|nr:diaminopimelate epimerase [bacterium endosymbiont of Pedicinus badii]OQM34087.1 hypothetical protein AOQ89_01940 [bacterium endosymbiont of Pedicinus badii]
MKKIIFFTKMHCNGNDCILLQSKNFLKKKQISLISNRYFGIGFDQLIYFYKSNIKEVDYFYTVFNSDGSLAKQCGNGLRCLSKYLQKKVPKKKIYLSNKKRIFCATFLKKNLVKINMGKPKFLYQKKIILEKNEKLICYIVSVENMHSIIFFKNIFYKKLFKFNYYLRKKYDFLKKLNISFVKVVNKTSLIIRTFEFGSGQTLSCGSASCAAVCISSIKKKLLFNKNINVKSKGGALKVFWKKQDSEIYTTGIAHQIYEGKITL